MNVNDFRQFRKEIRVEDGRRMTKRDYILLIALLVVYSLFAFLNLGSVRSPQNAWKADAETDVIIDLGETKEVTAVSFFGGIAVGKIGIYDESAFIGDYFRPDLAEPLTVYSQEYGDMFKWHTESAYTTTRYLVLHVQSGSVEINEMAVLNGSEVLPATVYEPQNGAEKLLDEQKTVKTDPSYLDEMYFDEIYHARTAYEILKNDDLLRKEGAEAAARDGYSIYETTHPTLGKLFIAVGIRIFGMTPFGWRFAGTFFGVLILAVLYVFGKRIFRRSDYAFITAALFAVDGMHFAQTRIATIDTYALCFTLLMFLFMGDYITEDFEKRPYWKKIALLGLSGLMFGLGVSSKWTCLYSGGGLAVLYFGDLIYNLVRLIRARHVHPEPEGDDLPEESEKSHNVQTRSSIRRFFAAAVSRMKRFVRRYRTSRSGQKKTPVNVLAYLPVLFVFVVILLHLSGKWVNIADYRHPSIVKGHYIMKTEAAYGVETIRQVLLQKWFYVTLLVLTGVAIASAVVFRLTFRKRDDVDLSLNNILMTPVWCCLFFIVIPIVLYVITNYCYYITSNSKTLFEKLKTLWERQWYMYDYHAYLDASHPCQSMWYQWPLAQKSVWFYSGGVTVGETHYLSNISSTGNPALWYISAFGAVFAIVEWVRNPECRRNRAFFVVFVGILAGLLPWALVTRCVFLYHYFSTIPFVMLLTLLLLFYVEQKYPRTAWFKWVWLAVSAVVFLLMLPAISGIPCTNGYARFIENVLAPFGKVYYVEIG